MNATSTMDAPTVDEWVRRSAYNMAVAEIRKLKEREKKLTQLIKDMVSDYRLTVPDSYGPCSFRLHQLSEILND